MTPHIHRDVIIAWANGAEVQVEGHKKGIWEDSVYPFFWPHQKYRVKPEPKKAWILVYKECSNILRCAISNSEEAKETISKNVESFKAIVLKDWTEITYEDSTS